MAKNMKRIHKVTVRRMEDDSPDTSWLGEYSNTPSGEFAIDRHHDEDCPKFWANSGTDELECDCRDHTERNTYQYFNPGSVEPFKTDATWIPTTVTGEKAREAYWREAMQKNAKQDYDRMEKLNDGYFSFIGIRADAEIIVPTGRFSSDARGGEEHLLTQTITSGGLWGIESDSDADYLKQIEDEQLEDLRGQLHAIGFSQRAITAAFRSVEREN